MSRYLRILGRLWGLPHLSGMPPRRSRSRLLLDGVCHGYVGDHLHLARLTLSVTDSCERVRARVEAGVARRAAEIGVVGPPGNGAETDSERARENGYSLRGILHCRLQRRLFQGRAVVDGVGDVGAVENDSGEAGRRAVSCRHDGVHRIDVADAHAQSRAAAVLVVVRLADELDVVPGNAGGVNRVDHRLQLSLCDLWNLLYFRRGRLSDTPRDTGLT